MAPQLPGPHIQPGRITSHRLEFDALGVSLVPLATVLCAIRCNCRVIRPACYCSVRRYAADQLTWLVTRSLGSAPMEVMVKLQEDIDECDRR